MDARIDPDSLRVLVDNHRRFLMFLERRVGSRAAAEDILQDALVRGIEKGGAIRDDESVVAWFYRVLRNALIDDQRRRATALRGTAQLLHEPSDRDDPELKNEICGCMTDLIGTLKPEYASALGAVDLSEGTLASFAEREQITPNNAAVRLHRAREALGKQLRASCGTCADHGCLDCTCKEKSPKSV